MKTKRIITGLMVLVALFTGQRTLAQGTTQHTEKVDMETGLVVWTGSTAEEVVVQPSQLDGANTKYFFLVEFKEALSVTDKEQYMGARGEYGVQGILSSVGMRMQLISSNRGVDLSNQPRDNCYQFVSRIDNADTHTAYLGDRMGIDWDYNVDAGYSIYLDRSGLRTFHTSGDPNGEHYDLCDNFPNWQLNKVTSYKYGVRYKGEADPHPVEVTTYTIQNVDTQKRGNYDNEYWNPQYTGEYQPTYIKIDNGRLVTTSHAEEATKWIIVSEKDFEDAMLEVTWGEVDLGVFVMDASFGRDNKDGVYWVWSKDGQGNPAQIVNGKTPDGMNLDPDAGKIHWHQRNQDIMINGVNLDVGNAGQNSNNQALTKRSTIGENVAGTGEDGVRHGDIRKYYAQYYSAEIYNEVNSLTQTLYGQNIPNLIDGLYKLTAQALYYDNGTGKTNNGVAYFIVKREVLGGADGQTVIETTEERMPVKPINSIDNDITCMSGVSAGKVFNENPDAYLLTTFVEISGNVRLTIGIEQTTDEGWTVIGNVHFYAHGKQALMIDEDWGTTAIMTYKVGDKDYDSYEGNPYNMAKWYDNYDYPSTVYYQRTFTLNAWNPICMPLSLTGRQVRQAFGADALVCGFLGQRDNDPDGCILFSRALDLDKDENMNKIVIKAGYPYIIYVTEPPQRKVPQDVGFIEVEVGNGQFNHTVKIDGNCYIIPGVIKERYTGYLDPQQQYNNLLPPKTIQPNGQDPNDEGDDEFEEGIYPYNSSYNNTKLIFKGSFYHEKLEHQYIHGSNNSNGDNDYWVITKGNMYHLTGAKDWNIWATYAYLYRPVEDGSPAKALSFAIDDGYGIQEIATSIEGLYVVSEENNVEDYEIYNLSGTKVGKGTLDTLPKGIYIMNGKKYVKK